MRTCRKFISYFYLSLFCLSTPLVATAQNSLESVDSIIELSGQKLNQTIQELSDDPSRHPSHTDTESGDWVVTEASAWTSGFFSGSLWLMYEQTGDLFWKDVAEKWTTNLEGQKNNTGDHDTGFRIMSSFGQGFRLIQRRDYQKVLQQAAHTLSSRYNPEIGCIKSWDWIGNYPVIIDNMMNLELLFWASQNGGKQEWYDQAVNHATNTLTNHIRPDGSTYHVVDYNDDGSIHWKRTVQGFNDESTWSRGQAWAIYGFTMSYRYTEKPEFLEAAIKTADYFVEHLPDDGIPFYDFEDPRIPDVSRDASAAAIAASALLELSEFANRNDFRETAVLILSNLISDTYLADEQKYSSILLKSTRQKGDPERGTIYADYYFLEALRRYQKSMGKVFPDIEPDFKLHLEQNYPNPFNPKTHIIYTIEEPENISVTVYDVAGRMVRVLISDFQQPGTYSLEFDGSGLSSGIYFYRLKTSGQMITKKMMLLK